MLWTWNLNWNALPDRTTNLVIRGAMLFSVGVFLALVLNLLQVQRNVTLFPPDVLSSIFSSAWWVPPCCGSASGALQKPSSGEKGLPHTAGEEPDLTSVQHLNVCLVWMIDNHILDPYWLQKLKNMVTGHGYVQKAHRAFRSVILSVWRCGSSQEALLPEVLFSSENCCLLTAHRCLISDVRGSEASRCCRIIPGAE